MKVTSLAMRRREIERAGTTELGEALATELRTLALQLNGDVYPSWMVRQIARTFASTLRVCSHFLGQREQADSSLPLSDERRALLESIEARPILEPVLTPSESDRVWVFVAGLVFGFAVGCAATWAGMRSLTAVGLLP